MRVLPSFYYLDHLLAVLEEVGRVHGVALGTEERRFIDDFTELPRLAQATWARMASRKGDYFRREHLTYAEIGDVEPRIALLRTRAFVRGLEEHDAEAWLAAQTKVDIVELLRSLEAAPTFRASWPKQRLVETASQAASFGELRRFDAHRGCTWVQSRTEPLAYIAFLYFGRYTEDLRAITLRDLGLLRLREGGGEATARFGSRDDARAAYFYERALHLLASDLASAQAEVHQLAAEMENWPTPPNDAVQDRRRKLMDALGRRAEASDDLPEALRLYEASGSSHAREREVRIRYAAGEREWVAARLESMIEDPESDAECTFAADFHARRFGGQRISAATELLRAGQSMALDEAYRHEPERAAVRHFESRGARAWYSENRLWQALFGLTFWDLLFGSGASGYHGEFDWLPATLRDRTFYAHGKKAIEARLDALGDEAAAHRLLSASHSQALQQPQGLFAPDWFEPADLLTLCASDAGPGIVQMLRSMAEDFPKQRSGYPDIVVLEGTRASFLEVKAEGDAVRRKQLVRLTQMRRSGLDASILNVSWRFDPDRVYAVVDLETTGRRSKAHRVTEVAIVRIQSGRELSRWSSLVNPERRIPGHITKLTGISDDMVANAPLFAEVADEIERHLDGALFVAHNVSFDYGFLRDEFRRIGREFHHPRLCTVVQMRRHFPGSPSYSLGALCREHGIALDHHHRALDDAVAASKLMMMVHGARCRPS